MRAATVRNNEIVIEEYPDAELGAGEVLVRVRAASLNRGELTQRRGLYRPPPNSYHDIPGAWRSQARSSRLGGRRTIRTWCARDGVRRRRTGRAVRRTLHPAVGCLVCDKPRLGWRSPARIVLLVTRRVHALRAAASQSG